MSTAEQAFATCQFLVTNCRFILGRIEKTCLIKKFQIKTFSSNLTALRNRGKLSVVVMSKLYCSNCTSGLIFLECN